MLRRLKSKDKSNFLSYCLTQKDSDFYITKNNERLFLNDIKICKKVFDDIMKRGDMGFVAEENNVISGLALIVGYSDKAERKYLKIHADSDTIADKLFKILAWNYEKSLFLKLKADNLFIKVAQHNRFRFIGNRGNEVLLCRNIENTRKKVNVSSDNSKHHH